MSKNPQKKIPGDQTTHYVSARKKRSLPKAKMQPPLTPMIDVTFQLLLFFLLTMSFREAEGQILGKLPAAGGENPDPAKQFNTHVDVGIDPNTDGTATYSIGNRSTSDRERLAQIFMDKAKEYGVEETPVILKPSKMVKWEYVLEAFNQAVRAGFKKVNFSPLDDAT